MIEKKSLQMLDGIRGLAALYVVIYHIIKRLNWMPKEIKLIFSFGQEAVMVFFLLSGFVIYWSISNTPNLTFSSYFKKRFRRIYFPFIISILLSIIVFYYNGNLTNKFSWAALFGNLLMVQDLSDNKPGVWVKPFLDNTPIWSLTYEWWFYMMFFPVYKTLFKNANRIYYILGFSLISYLTYLGFPNQVSLVFAYFIIWWCGVEIAVIYKHTESLSIAIIKPILYSLTAMLVLTLIPVLITQDFRISYHPFLPFRHFLFVEFIIIAGVVYYQNKIKFLNRFILKFMIFAPISYGLYIFHYPILFHWNLSNYNIVLVYLLKLSLLFALAYIVEVKLQPIINRWIR